MQKREVVGSEWKGWRVSGEIYCFLAIEFGKEVDREGVTDLRGLNDTSFDYRTFCRQPW